MSSLFTAGDAASITARTEMSLAYRRLLCVGAPIAFVVLLSLFGDMLKVFKNPTRAL